MEASDPNDLAALLARRALTEDAARPDAVARRHAGGGRTARENVEDLIDPGSWVEYGRFAIAAQRKRRDVVRADRPHARRRADRRHRARERAAVRGALLRLHGAGRDAGHDRPCQEGPPVRADRAAAAAGRVLRRGRRGAARRHRPARRLVAAHARVRAVGAAGGQGAADRDRPRPLLRGQRRDRGLQRPDRRHARRLAGHGRPGDDRRRRARRRRARRHRPDRDTGAQRRRRPGRRRRGRRRSRPPSACSGTSAAQPRTVRRARPDAAARRSCRRARAAPTTSSPSSKASPTRTPSRSCASASRPSS